MISSAKTLVMVRFGLSGGFRVSPGYSPADGEVLEVEKYHPGFDRMISAGYFTEIPPGTNLLIHEPTGRRFASVVSLEQYARDYENPQKRDRAPRRYEPVLPEIAPTVEPEAAPRSRPGHPEDAEWRSWTLQTLIDILKSGLQKAQKDTPNNKRIGITHVAPATGYSRRDLGRSMKKHGYTWEMIRPLLND